MQSRLRVDATLTFASLGGIDAADSSFRCVRSQTNYPRSGNSAQAERDPVGAGRKEGGRHRLGPERLAAIPRAGGSAWHSRTTQAASLPFLLAKPYQRWVDQDARRNHAVLAECR